MNTYLLALKCLARTALLTCLWMIGIIGTIGTIRTAHGEILTIDEDFSGTQRRDPGATTAVWDTMSLNAHLPPQSLFARSALNTTAAYFSALSAGKLYLADGLGGLRSIDIDDPENPALLDVVSCPDQAKGVAVGSGHAYVAIGGSGLQVVDISDPDDLADLGAFEPGGPLRYVNAVATQGPAVYLAESDSGVTVLDVSTPSAPALVRRLDTGAWARDVHVQGNRLYVADTQVSIYSLATPFAPALLGRFAVTGTPLRVTVQGNRAFVACGAEGLQIFDVTDPAEVVALGTIDWWGSCRHATAGASGDTVFVTAGTEGLTVIDATDPAEPVELGLRDTIQAAVHVLHHDGLILVANLTDGLKIYELDPQGLDGTRNIVQTLNLNNGEDPVTRVALNALYADSVYFGVSGDGGNNWTDIQPDGSWLSLDNSGVDIRWRARLALHDGSPPEGPRIVSVSLTMDRLSSNPAIIAVDDVPADGGGKLRLRWHPSRHDTEGSEHPITEYSLYRRFDTAAMDTSFALAYPPGSWDYVMTVPADRENEYAAVVPSLADSCSTGIPWTVYFVRARTGEPGLFFDSPPDSGYSVNNQQPAPPTGFAVNYNHPDGTHLSWHPPAGPEFAHFRIYRSLLPDQAPSPGTLHAVTTEISYLDETSRHFFYQLTVVNQSGHESDPAGLATSSVGAPTVDLRFQGNHPNPFNPATEISFVGELGAGPIVLEIFDARGRHIRRYLLTDGDGGPQKVRWDGRDNHGGPCSSGVYFSRVSQGSAHRLGKMLLVR